MKKMTFLLSFVLAISFSHSASSQFTETFASSCASCLSFSFTQSGIQYDVTINSFAPFSGGVNNVEIVPFSQSFPWTMTIVRNDGNDFEFTGISIGNNYFDIDFMGNFVSATDPVEVGGYKSNVLQGIAQLVGPGVSTALTFNEAVDEVRVSSKQVGIINSFPVTFTNFIGNNTVTPTDEIDPVLTSLATASFAENGTGTAYTIIATDANAITYSLSTGNDEDLFNVEPSTGAVTFQASPDFEIPVGNNADNTYVINVIASDGINSVNQDVTITVTDVDEINPVFTSLATASFAENGTGIAYTIIATDANAITYSLGTGNDEGLFSVTAGAVTFQASPDFEIPVGNNADNTYVINVIASDGINSVNQDVTITVTDVDEIDPVFTSLTTASFAENGTGTAYTITATDTNVITYSLGTGNDEDLFSVAPSTGAVTFQASPDFEAPNGNSPNNTYVINVIASDGINSVNQDVTITVTDVDEIDPIFTSLTIANFAENGTGTAYTIIATDANAITYSLGTGNDEDLFSVVGSTGAVTFQASPDFEAPNGNSPNNTYVINVIASDGINSVNQDVTITVTDVFEGSTWSGATDTDWGTATNWVGDVLPISTDDVVIPATANDPVITSDIEIKSIHVETGAVVTISTNSLEVTNDITLDGNMAVTSGASLVPLGTITGSGVATIHRNTTFGVTDGQYSVIGSPITVGSTSSLGGIVYSYDETVAYDPSGTAGGARFVSVATPETMAKGDAYFSANTGSISFVGTPNSGNIDVPLVYDETRDEGLINAGFNLVSNPYPASIFFPTFVIANPDIDGAIYVWDDGGSDLADRTSADYIVATNGMGITGGSGRIGSADGYLRSTQGFFVKAITAGTLHFTPSMMAPTNNSDAGYFREEKPTVLRFALSSDENYSDILLGFSDNTTEAFDRNYDAYKFKGNSVLQLSSKMGESLMAIQALPRVEDEIEVNLEIDIAKAGTYTFELEEASSYGFELYLKDALLDKLVDLSADNSYIFQSASVSSSDRFSLIFSPYTVLNIEDEFKSDGMTVYSNAFGLNVNILSKPSNANVKIYNLSGTLMKQVNQVDFSEGNWATSFTGQGLFIMSIQADGQLFIKKFISK